MDYEGFDWSGMRFGEAYTRSLFSLARTGNFTRGLEVGFDSGSSAVAFLRACPHAKLVSVDITACPEGAMAINKNDLYGRHTFIVADSRVELPVFVANGMRFDWIYIDGDHLYEPTLSDLENAAKLLDEDGVIVVDDAGQHAHFRVHEAVVDFLSSHGDFYASEVVGSPNGAVVLRRKNV